MVAKNKSQGGIMKLLRVSSLLILITSGAILVALPSSNTVYAEEAATSSSALQPNPPPWPAIVKRLGPSDFVEQQRTQLPSGVKAFGEGGDQNWLKSANPRIARFDLNGDGVPELIVDHSSYWLSSGTLYEIYYKKHGNTYERIADLEGTVGVVVLEMADGFNQIEGWNPGDGEKPTYAKQLWRYNGKRYQLVREDNYVTNEAGKLVYSGTRTTIQK